MFSTLTLRRGQEEYFLCQRIEECEQESGRALAALPLLDSTTALYFLHEVIADSAQQHDLRLWLLNHNLWFAMNTIDDDFILNQAACMIASGQLVVAGTGQGAGSESESGEGGSVSEGIMRKGGGKSVLRSSVATTALQDEMANQQSPAADEVTPLGDLTPETTWVEIELLDPNGNPVAGERFKITMPDGSVRYGRLDGDGKARIEKLQPGSCQVTFPDRDEEIWNVE